MFQAGEVAPSCSLLLQLLTLTGEVDPFCGGGDLVGLHRPEPESPVLVGASVGALPYSEDEALLAFETPRPRRPVGVAGPVVWGLSTFRLLRGPIDVGKAAGFALLAARLKAPRDWRTWVGSFCS